VAVAAGQRPLFSLVAAAAFAISDKTIVVVVVVVAAAVVAFSYLPLLGQTYSFSSVSHIKTTKTTATL